MHGDLVDNSKEFELELLPSAFSSLRHSAFQNLFQVKSQLKIDNLYINSMKKSVVKP